MSVGSAAPLLATTVAFGRGGAGGDPGTGGSGAPAASGIAQAVYP
jgi:hypothetical protein